MKDVNINISIPQEILLTLREKNDEFAINMKRWAALKLYEIKKLSVGQCAQLAEMNEEDFIVYLGENKISIFPYQNINELKEDVSHA
jgi:predicted HTH domain antitoxin